MLFIVEVMTRRPTISGWLFTIGIFLSKCLTRGPIQHCNMERVSHRNMESQGTTTHRGRVRHRQQKCLTIGPIQHCNMERVFHMNMESYGTTPHRGRVRHRQQKCFMNGPIQHCNVERVSHMNMESSGTITHRGRVRHRQQKCLMNGPIQHCNVERVSHMNMESSGTTPHRGRVRLSQKMEQSMKTVSQTKTMDKSELRHNETITKTCINDILKIFFKTCKLPVWIRWQLISIH
ncbi:uncharacterized protein LOC124266263 isoform X6 [Haliotis rubra]|uniref:uncharacterized protein LOC124266263 isoform X6 n=1 Tax=Haliotis rubra TaxID=36100 RepID=UPI001EE5AF9D|nr:uncharacterized protein LOC124266263 isoform X6 [Haliotis rubra]XP_046557039.1 uncharacterized protein LOC124266263 isoform X6 [Haliotis rubra]XP_046557040.1 uncharacterized protein LOC124266263 isoform X6 [Haliotis rubra]